MRVRNNDDKFHALTSVFAMDSILHATKEETARKAAVVLAIGPLSSPEFVLGVDHIVNHSPQF